MLTIEALNAGMPLAQLADARNARIVPVEGTPLHDLVNQTRSGNEFMQHNPSTGEYEPDLNTIVFVANNASETTKINLHDTVLDGIAEVAIASLQKQIQFARTVVAPAVDDLVGRVTKAINEMTPSSLLGLEICVFDYPSAMTHNSLVDMVAKFGEVSAMEPDMLVRLPNMPVSEITELMMTSTGSLDNYIRDWLAAKGDSFVIRLWENLFQVNPDRENRTFEQWMNDRSEGVDFALGVFLLARRLVEDPISGIDMNKLAFETMMADMRNQAARSLIWRMETAEREAKVGALVRGNTGKVLTVNGPVYRQWLENGGDNDVLMGLMVSSDRIVHVSEIDARATEFRTSWVRHCALVATAESNRRHTRIKDVLKTQFEMQRLEAQKDEPTAMGDPTSVVQTFRNLVDELTVAEVEDLWSTCLKLECRTVYARSDAERILSGIEMVKRKHPNVEVREAAAISLIDYIGAWVASQIRVIPV